MFLLKMVVFHSYVSLPEGISTNYDHDREHDYVYDHDHDYTLWVCGFKYSAHICRNYSDALCHYVYMSRKLSYPLFLRIVLVKSSVGFVSSNFADSQTYYPEIYWHSIENPCRMWTLFEDDIVMEIPNELHHPPSRPWKLTGISWCFPLVETLCHVGVLGTWGLLGSSQETWRIHQGASFIIASTQSTLGFSGTNQGLGLQGFPSLHACGVFLFLFCVPRDVLFLLCPTVAAMIKLTIYIYISYKQSLEKGALFIAQLKKTSGWFMVWAFPTGRLL